MQKKMAILGLFTFLFKTTQVEAQTSNSNKTVLITGAASGIGKATAIEFTKKGYNTFATDKDTSNMKDLEKLGCKVKYIDVTIDSVMVEAVKEIEKETGGIDVLVNNAGFGQNGVIEELSIDKIRKQFEIGRASCRERVLMPV